MNSSRDSLNLKRAKLKGKGLVATRGTLVVEGLGGLELGAGTRWPYKAPGGCRGPEML